MQSLKGKLLLDGGKLAGSEFHRTVVLICAHDPTGAFGLVLNRRSEFTVGEVVTESLPDPIMRLALYLGGPVQPQALSCLIQDPATGEESAETVLPGLRLTHTLDDLVEPGGAIAPLKFFAGYAGWGPGQLDNELKHGAWLIQPASIDHAFDPHPEQLWQRILRNMGPAYRLLAEAPDNLSQN